jgi:hypothetical protein
MSYLFEECQDLEIWDEFVAKSLQSNIFCFSKFITLTYTNFKLYFVKKNGNVMLGCILILDSKGKNSISPFMYQGVLFDKYMQDLPSHRFSKITLDLFEFLIISLEKYYDHIALSLHYTIKDIRAFQWFNYHEVEKKRIKIIPRYTGILNMENSSSFDSIFKQSRKVRRQEYHKSIKNGFNVSLSKDIGVLDDLHESTFLRQGVKRTDVEKLLVRKVSEIAIDEGFGRLLICSNNHGEPVSASMFLLDDVRGYYLVGATNPKFRNDGVGSLVMFEQIKMCYEDGLTAVDFIGINSPQRGDFKSSFNAKSELYFDLKYTV